MACVRPRRTDSTPPIAATLNTLAGENRKRASRRSRDVLARCMLLAPSAVARFQRLLSGTRSTTNDSATCLPRTGTMWTKWSARDFNALARHRRNGVIIWVERLITAPAFTNLLRKPSTARVSGSTPCCHSARAHSGHAVKCASARALSVNPIPTLDRAENNSRTSWQFMAGTPSPRYLSPRNSARRSFPNKTTQTPAADSPFQRPAPYVGRPEDSREAQGHPDPPADMLSSPKKPVRRSVLTTTSPSLAYARGGAVRRLGWNPWRLWERVEVSGHRIDVRRWRNPAPSRYNQRDIPPIHQHFACWLWNLNRSGQGCGTWPRPIRRRPPPLSAPDGPERGVPGRRLLAAAHHGEDLLEISDTLRPVIEDPDLGEA